LVPAVILIEKGNHDRLPMRSQIQYGFYFGLLSNGLLLYWMVIALWRYTPLSILGYAGTVLLLSAFYAALFALCGWIIRTTGVSLLLAFPTMWTALEWVLAHLADLRFPWLGLGTSLTGFPTIVQLADIVGARGVTLLLALANTALALAWIGRRNGRHVFKMTAAVCVGVVLAMTYGLVRERVLETRQLGEVAVLQPNLGYETKWDPELRDSIFASVMESTTVVDREVDPSLIVWPEVALPDFLRWRPDWMSRIVDFARLSNTSMVIGALDFDSRPDSTGIRYNSSFVVDSAGRFEDYPVYRKQYLVPITERVPFLHGWTLGIRWFGSLGAGEGGAVYELSMGSFGIVICYESAFENLAREYRANGADFLVNITNDAWFGRTTTPYQHASHLVMRAIENRIGVVRAANTGVSELVNPLGRTHGRTRLEEETSTGGTLWTSDTVSLYTRLGDWVGGTTVLMALALMAYARLRKWMPC
jgi:apolipoprotein N-acyltransferase